MHTYPVFIREVEHGSSSQAVIQSACLLLSSKKATAGRGIGPIFGSHELARHRYGGALLYLPKSIFQSLVSRSMRLNTARGNVT